MDLLIPEYNILKNAYSLLGFKHSQETILKLKEKVISPEHKKILSSIHLLFFLYIYICKKKVRERLSMKIPEIN
jgi:hypothetical protein